MAGTVSGFGVRNRNFTADELKKLFWETLKDSVGMRLAFRPSYIKFDEPGATILPGLSYKEWNVGDRYWINRAKLYETGESFNGMDVAYENMGEWEQFVFESSFGEFHHGITPSEDEITRKRQERAVRIVAFVELAGRVKTRQEKKNLEKRKLSNIQILDIFCAVFSEKMFTKEFPKHKLILRGNHFIIGSHILLFWLGSLEKVEEK